MSGVALSESVKAYLRRGGYTQKELAKALGLNPHVLSRKLNGGGNAFLTHQEIQRLVTILADWHAITTRDEALHLLKVAQVEPTIFSDDEWSTPPLSTLVEKHAQPTLLGDSRIPAHAHAHNFPTPATRLIGREWAVERLRQLLGHDDVRLVTLVGPGGSGKTRLALEVARELAGTFAHGAWLVALAGQREAALVPLSIMQVLNLQSAPGVPPLQSLIAFLKYRSMLLVLDNFEQLGETSSVVDELLSAVPGLKVLITSRTVLRLNGEHRFSVPPLDLPDPDHLPEAGELAQYGAVQLFLERAQAIDPDFVLTQENAAVIARICARVDGLPLALELAAARVRVLPPALLLERLSQARLPLLTRGARNVPGRQQTLRATIAWSYDLLSGDEQAWFRRLGVFSGGCSLEAAEALMQNLLLPPGNGPHPRYEANARPIGTGNGEGGDAKNAPVSGSPVDMLEQLVDDSLLVRVPIKNGQARLSMLETLREYALEQLAAQGEDGWLRDWHASYYLEEAEAAERGMRGPQQLAWLTQVGEDRGNFRAALEWSLQRAREGLGIRTFSSSPARPMGIAVAGSRTFCAQGVNCDGMLAIELCLRLSAALRPYWEWRGYLAEARYWLGAALEVPLEHGVGETALAARAKALSEASRLVCLQNDQKRAVELAEESIALWRRLDDPSGLGTALLHRGWAAHAQGEYEVAARAYEEGLEHVSSEEDPWLRGQLLFYLGAAAGFSFDFARMRELYAQSRQFFEQVGDTSAVADLLKDQGGMFLLEGKCIEAIEYLLGSLRLCYELGHKQYMMTGLCLLSLAVGMREQPDAATASIHSAKLQGAADGLMEATGFTPWTRDNVYAQMIRQHIRSRVDEQHYETAWSEGRALTLEQAIDLACRLGE